MSEILPPVPARCECDWKFHEGDPCGNDAAEYDDLIVSPALCVPCLHVCCGERDDELDYVGKHPAEVTE